MGWASKNVQTCQKGLAPKLDSASKKTAGTSPGKPTTRQTPGQSRPGATGALACAWQAQRHFETWEAKNGFGVSHPRTGFLLLTAPKKTPKTKTHRTNTPHQRKCEVEAGLSGRLKTGKPKSCTHVQGTYRCSEKQGADKMYVPPWNPLPLLEAQLRYGCSLFTKRHGKTRCSPPTSPPSVPTPGRTPRSRTSPQSAAAPGRTETRPPGFGGTVSVWAGFSQHFSAQLAVSLPFRNNPKQDTHGTGGKKLLSSGLAIGQLPPCQPGRLPKHGSELPTSPPKGEFEGESSTQQRAFPRTWKLQGFSRCYQLKQICSDHG